MVCEVLVEELQLGMLVGRKGSSVKRGGALRSTSSAHLACPPPPPYTLLFPALPLSSSVFTGKALGLPLLPPSLNRHRRRPRRAARRAQDLHHPQPARQGQPAARRGLPRRADGRASRRGHHHTGGGGGGGEASKTALALLTLVHTSQLYPLHWFQSLAAAL